MACEDRLHKLERRLSELENYVLALENRRRLYSEEDQNLIEDVHCLIQFFSKFCDCFGKKNENKVIPTKESDHHSEESKQQQASKESWEDFERAIQR